MRIRVNMRRKQYFVRCLNPCLVSYSQNHISFRFSKTHLISHQFSQKSVFLISVPLRAFFSKFHISPTALKVIGPFTPPFSWRYQPFRSRFRLSYITELNSLFVRSVYPATHTTQSRPSCITELNSLFARSVHRVLYTRSPSSKFSPRTGSGASAALPQSIPFLQILSANLRWQPIISSNQSHLISFPKISFHFISQKFHFSFKTHFKFLINDFSISRPVT